MSVCVCESVNHWEMIIGGDNSNYNNPPCCGVEDELEESEI
jgi:hypothetical protein